MLRFILIFMFITGSLEVDKSKFKTCDQSGFCRRSRKFTDQQQPIYEIDPESIEILNSDGVVNALIANTRDQVKLKLTLTNIKNGIVRLNIVEAEPLHPRYRPQFALVSEPEPIPVTVTHRDAKSLRLRLAADLELLLHYRPIKVELVRAGLGTVIAVNSRRMFNFEHYRVKPQPVEAEPQQQQEQQEPVEQADGEVDDDIGAEGAKDDNEHHQHEDQQHQQQQQEEEAGMWEEHFGTHEDTKPRGPSAVSGDVVFPGSRHVYGIPEHADTFALRDTVGAGAAAGGDPYRLYNLDVFEYETDQTMALYGSVPFIVSHSGGGTAGVFWHNAAETWVDIESLPGPDSLLSKVSSYLSGGGGGAGGGSGGADGGGVAKSVRWMSESGEWDMFLLAGPDPAAVMSQYGQLTGTTELPPLFALGYHQCRWNYNDQRDVLEVHDQFDRHQLPLDVIWLDIEHTDGKRYFTWDEHRFPEPRRMIDTLAGRGRKMVTIVDPHIKRDDNYQLHSDAVAGGFYVKNRDGADFDGWCWPGSSSYLDFYSAAVRDYWASRLSLDNYRHSTLSLFTWNDMNEPSVFSGPEVTMPKDARHVDGWEHRDVHNEYGMLAPMCTARGQVERSGGRQRPFVLTRAAFAGSQRFGAKWTGDNTASWSHLRASLPMLLSSSVAGISFIGADVGGFFGDPDTELLVRWYQAAAFQPFYRAHAHIDTRRREPYLFDNSTVALVRHALQRRYRFLPLWYTLFYENTAVSGLPPMRPLWMHFGQDAASFSVENEYMVGDALLVHPQTEQGGAAVSVYLPAGGVGGPPQAWYDIDTLAVYTGQGSSVTFDTPLNKMVVLQRAGTIVPQWRRVRRSSSAMRHDPYTLVVALGPNQTASGTLFADDGSSFDYTGGEFAYMRYQFARDTLTSTVAGGKSGGGGGGSSTSSKHHLPARAVERVVLLGLAHEPASVRVAGAGAGGTVATTATLQYNRQRGETVVRRPGVLADREWSIHFQF